jgi:hypothetical protein
MIRLLLSATLVAAFATVGVVNADAATKHKKHHVTKMKSMNTMSGSAGQSPPPANSTVKSQGGQASPTAGSK